MREVELEDKYADEPKPCLVNGPQALVRLLLAQKRRDEKAGLNTAGFVSGYRGSPLGYVDQTLWDAEAWLKKNKIVFQPGINEDLAATAVWGTQQISVFKDATVDGVFAMWYGKGPGVDRSGDALKHGNYSGADRSGGVLVLLGDDHPGKSSTVAHHSEQAMVAHQMPVLYPANVTEFMRFGLLGWALSRYTGCWCAFKLVNETIEQTSTATTDSDFEIVNPAKGETPPEGLYYRGVFAAARDEVIHKRYRIPLAQRFCRANGIDRAEFGIRPTRLGLVTAGKAYGDVLQAFRYLGIDRLQAASLGIDIYKVGMIWPLEPEGLREFSEGCQELLFVEEKSAFMEPQATAIFYNDSTRPRIVGKFDELGAALLPSDVQIDPLGLAELIAQRLSRNGAVMESIHPGLDAVRSVRSTLIPNTEVLPRRLPFFCSGCPHSTSTSIPEGSVAMSGIGCHGMAMWAKPGTTLMGTHMGAEGVTWSAIQHFSAKKHIFQNIGDGTYYHSGLLAIRQSIAAKANITYKILLNDAVAMTGGQPVDGPLSAGMIARQMLAEGAARVVLVCEDPQRHAQHTIPSEVKVLERRELDAVQRELRDLPGCTVLIYDQVCAAEKRRRRKRRQLEDPAVRTLINADVCEGCGDCSVKSSCVSIEPLETELGRKRQINQSSCNKDFSCVQGFCPSFVTVHGVQPRKRASTELDRSLWESLPEPPIAANPPMGTSIMLAGIGGTGVVTVGAVLAMAAHVHGLQASVYDMTGIAQKNGAVLSHLRIAEGERPIPTQTIGLGEANVVIAVDMVAAVAEEAFRTMSPSTRFLGNQRVQPTASFNFNPDERVDTEAIMRRIQSRIETGNVVLLDATGIALAMCGDAIGSNFFLIGVALQLGWLPLSMPAIVRSIELNGVQVKFNLNALQLGRLWVHDPETIRRMLPKSSLERQASVQRSIDELISDRADRLQRYQDASYERRFRLAIERVRSAEALLRPGSHELTEKATETLYRLMSYKDEYEVARMHTDRAFLHTIHEQFEGHPKLRFHLAPPLFAKKDPRTGHLIKKEYGSWVMPVFGLLAHLKRLRGTPFDIFGYTTERRRERQSIVRYEKTLLTVLGHLRDDNFELAKRVIGAASTVRGFGHVKELSQIRADQEEQRLLAEYLH